MPAVPRAGRVLPFKLSGQKLPSCRRIRQRHEFEAVFQAQRQTSLWFVVYFRKRQEGVSRLGVVVGKKFVSKATARNYIRRIVREEFRHNFPTESPMDVVVRVRRQAKPEELTAGRLALGAMLRKIQE